MAWGLALTLLLSAVSLIGCRDSGDGDEFTGIVQTIEGSPDPISDDPEDWQPRCTSPFPEHFCALPASPNPALHATMMRFGVGDTADVELYVLSAPDRRVRTILEGRAIPGQNLVFWDLKNDAGQQLPDGIYRVYIEGTVSGKKIESFGDVQIVSHTQ